MRTATCSVTIEDGRSCRHRLVWTEGRWVHDPLWLAAHEPPSRRGATAAKLDADHDPVAEA